MSDHHKIYAEWRSDPESFWQAAATEIDWYKPADKIFDPDAGVHGHWFVGAQCNTCYNCLDRQVEAGRGKQAAIIYDSPITGAKRTISYDELLEEVSSFAAGLENLWP